jgi:hypothetical protein
MTAYGHGKDAKDALDAAKSCDKALFHWYALKAIVHALLHIAEAIDEHR